MFGRNMIPILDRGIISIFCLSLASLTLFRLTISKSYEENVVFNAVTNAKPLVKTSSFAESTSSASGRLFQGNRIRVYEGDRMFHTTTKMRGPNPVSPRLHPFVRCAKWNVVTTIYKLSDAVKRASMVEGWCTVIVADTKTPKNYLAELNELHCNGEKEADFTKQKGRLRDVINCDSKENNLVVFLSVESQNKWLDEEQSDMTDVGKFLDAIPFAHFSRKNVGYLYAISHGAEIIFDFDDDNLLPRAENGTVIPPIHDSDTLKGAAMVVTGPKAFNHHTIMNVTVEGSSWPRGFPLNQIQNSATQGMIAIESGEYRDVSIKSEVGVLQFVADNNPDVDAIHRLVQADHTKPVFFKRHIKYDRHSDNGNSHLDADSKDGYYDSISKLSTMGSLVVPSHTFVSYNAQATLHTQKALFAMLLPSTVQGRVSDIWRAYFAQCLFRNIDTATSIVDRRSGNDGLKVVILPPDIVQDRNEHSLLSDMQGEEDLYYKTDALLEFLNEWEYSHIDDVDASIVSWMEDLWIALYEHDYIELGDVKVLQLWLSALIEIGYEFPNLQRQNDRRIRDVVLAGQFNFDNDNYSTLLLWYQKWKQRFHHVVIRGPFSNSTIREMTSRHEIDVRATRKDLSHDSGFVSPMDNLLSTLKVYAEDPRIKGVALVHDDMLLDVASVFGGHNRSSEIIFGYGNKGVYSPAVRYRIHPSWIRGESSDASFFYTMPDGYGSNNGTELLSRLIPWYHDRSCLKGLNDLAMDRRIEPFLQQNQHVNRGASFLEIAHYSQSDFIYIPTRLTKHYQAIAEQMIDHRVFLECAFPTIFDILLRGNNNTALARVVGNLCTSWDDSRGTLRMVSACKKRARLSNDTYEAIHPFKLNIHGYKTWDRMFDWATA